MREQQLSLLKDKLNSYALHIENMFDKCLKGFVDSNPDSLNHLIHEDEPKANQFDIEMDRICANYIAQYQPMAKDLRNILMAFKLNTDLERVGDLTVNISQSALFILAHRCSNTMKDLPSLFTVVGTMLKDSIQAFLTENPALAQNVCERDELADHIRDEIYKTLIEQMSHNSKIIECSLHYMRIARNLEKIADVSTNIGEEAIFLVEGKNIKHHSQNKI